MGESSVEAVTAYPGDRSKPANLLVLRMAFDKGRVSRDAEVAALTAELYLAREVVEALKANEPPCDGGCNINDGPEETCSAHGRSTADVWEIAYRAMAERDQLQKQIKAALAEMDRSMYGDREIPFNMRAALTEGNK